VFIEATSKEVEGTNNHIPGRIVEIRHGKIHCKTEFSLSWTPTEREGV